MLLSTKIHIPHISLAKVQRPALIENFNRGMNTKLTLITAPAGYGKTTALSEWVNQSEATVAWVSLDGHDNSPVRFWSYVMAAIETAVPAFDKIASADDVVLTESFLTALITELNNLPTQLALILDDFHLIENSSINNALAYLLEYLPSHIHLFVASRSELSLPLSRLKIRGQLQEITAADLRFQLEEGINFFQDCMDLSLSEDEVSQLVVTTEGWIGGLQLAALALRKTDNHPAFIREFSGEQRDVVNYLFEEMFQHQPVELRTFLLETSMLTRMNGSLCEAVTGRTNGQDKLELLVRTNMLIIPLDEQKCWYRYHHLLSDFLQQHLKRKHPKRWAQLLANAAKWSEAHDLQEEAIDYYIAGNHYSDTIRMIEEGLSSLMQLERTRLYGWLSVIPELFFADKPVLTIFYISVLISVGKLALAESHLRMAQGELAKTVWAPFASTIYLFCGNIAYIRRNTEQASAFYEEFEKRSSEGSKFQALGGNMGYTIQSNDYDNMLAFINDLHMADSFLLRWIQAWESKQSYTYLGYLLVSYSELMYEWNRLKDAERYSTIALEREDMQPFARILVQAAIKASCIRQAKGDIAEALELLEQVKSKLNSPDLPVFIKRIETQKAYLSLIQEHSDFASEWLKSCGLKYSDELQLYRISEYLCLARALGQCGHLAKAKHLLERLYRLVTREDRLRDTIQVLIVQSMTLHRNGETDAALLKLDIALTLAEPHGYIRSFVDEGKRMKELLSNYLQLRQISFIREPVNVSLLYVKQLLQTMHVNVEGALSLRSFILTEKEMNVLRMIEQGMSNQQIAEHQYILVSTVKTHIQNMYKKLKVNNRFQAVQRGKELNML